MNGQIASLLLTVAVCGPAVAVEDNTWDPKRGLALTPAVLAGMGIAVGDVTERTVPVVRRAAVRLPAAGARGLAVAAVATADLRWWKPGAAVRIRPDGGARWLEGTVATVDRTLAQATGVAEVLVSVDLPAAQGGGRSGGFGTAEVRSTVGPGVFAPRAAVIERNGESFVYVENEGRYQRIPIKTGVRTDDWCEVTDGLLEGDRLVTGDVAALWIAELRASTSGGRCCPL